MSPVGKSNPKLLLATNNPGKALAMYFKANPEVKQVLDRRAFKLVIGQFAHSQTMSVNKWERFARFAKDLKVIDRQPTASDLFTNLIP